MKNVLKPGVVCLILLCIARLAAGQSAQFEVLVPDEFDGSKNYRVLYLLPVEARNHGRYGDAMAVIRELDAHNRHDLIVVKPGFEVDPWYGNHATDPRRRFEDQLVLNLIPEIDRRYPTLVGARGRLLLGFNKSGWGAFTLILRHPDVFGYAASWDAPLMLTSRHFGVWKTDQTFGTAANMAAYLPSALLREHAADFKANTRLVLAGKNLFGTTSDRRFPYRGISHTEGAHALMVQLGIRHRYDPNLKANPTWNAQWVKPVLEMLCKLAESNEINGALNTSNP